MRKISLILALLIVFTLIVSCNKGDTPPEVTTTPVYHEPNAPVRKGEAYPASIGASYIEGYTPTGVIVCNEGTPEYDFKQYAKYNYTWKNVSVSENEYLRSYMTCFSETGLDRAEYEYLFTYTKTNEIFLLDENGNEGKYVLYMLYDEGVLIAEIIIEKMENGHFRIANQRVLDRNEHPTWTMMLHFYRTAERMQDRENDEIEIVGYNGERFLVVNPQQNTDN